MGLNIGITPIVMFPPKDGSVPDVRSGLIGDGGWVGQAETDDSAAYQIIRCIICAGGLPMIVLLQFLLGELPAVVPMGDLTAGAQMDKNTVKLL